MKQLAVRTIFSFAINVVYIYYCNVICYYNRTNYIAKTASCVQRSSLTLLYSTMPLDRTHFNPNSQTAFKTQKCLLGVALLVKASKSRFLK